MEFGDLGTHCGMEFCQQQDFLPFKCEFCFKVYCADHRRTEDHQCSSNDPDAIDDNYVILCPICKTSLSLKGKTQLGITPAHVWNEHVETGECQLMQNTRNAKQQGEVNGRSTHC